MQHRHGRKVSEDGEEHHEGRVKVRLAVIGGALILLLSASYGWASTSIEKVTGAGVQIVDDNGGVRTLSFSVRQLSDGTVVGEAQVARFDTGVIAHYAINCLRVDTTADGYARATVSGTVSSSDVPTWVGRPMWFQVVDRGSSDKTDMATPSIVFVSDLLATCEDDVEAGFIHLYEVTAGNVVIH